MKRLLFFIVCLIGAVHLWAVPAKPGQKRTLPLADGTTIEATLVGDEHGHYWLADDGKAYLSSSGKGFYQQVDARAIMAAAKERRAVASAQNRKRLVQRRASKVSPFTGKKKGLIILVNFSDATFQQENNKRLFERIANEKNFSYGNFKGSVHDYFYDQSLGAEERFELDFDIAGPYTLSKELAYYGEDAILENGKVRKDIHIGEMIIESLRLADEDVDFKDYVWDSGSDEVDQVYVLYAGKGQADGGEAETIWPKEWNLASTNHYYNDGEGRLMLDGVWLDTFACGSELNGDGVIAGIGTICHEFSHCLGYPDLYDTDYSGGQGMGYWDLMCNGSYNDNGYQPAGYTSWERWQAGWLTPTELSATQMVTGMKALQDGGESYVIYNPGYRDEYFLLENRQKTGWDASLPGAGLLIMHVDYDAKVWRDNEVNDSDDYQRMTWIPADNDYQYLVIDSSRYYTPKGMATDTYPYGDNNSFSKSSTPTASLYHANTDGTYFLDSSVESITQNDDADKTISFNFRRWANSSLDMLELTVLSIENWNFDKRSVDGNYLRGSLTLRNHDVVKKTELMSLWLKDLGTQTSRVRTFRVDIAPDDTGIYGFSFGNLTIGHQYVLTLNYQSGETLYETEPFSCTFEDDGETIAGNEDLTRCEYWFDEDYAHKQYVYINDNRAVVRISADATGLDDGIHRMNVRVLREDGKYSAVSSSVFTKFGSETEAHLDYWFDDNFEQRSTMTMADTEDEQLLSLDLSDNELFPTGFHWLHIQVGLPGCVTSADQVCRVLKVESSNADVLEYWFDEVDVKKTQRLTGTSVSDGYVFVDDLDLRSLPNGVHRLYYRASSNDGLVNSSIERATIMKIFVGETQQLEYWFDNDYEGRAQLSGKAASDGNGYVFVDDLDLSQVAPGYHRLYLRASSSDGLTATQVVSADVVVMMDKTSKLEYWFDDDIKNSKVLVGNAASDGDGYVFVNDLDLSGVSRGVHRLYYRGRSDDGFTVTSVCVQTVYVGPLYNDSAGEPVLTAYSISIDDGEPIAFGSMNGTVEEELELELDVSDYEEGSYTLSATFWNSYGKSTTDWTPFWVTGSLTGDVNQDGQVGIGDIVAITNVMAGITTDEVTKQRADVNGDGQVGIGDIVAITNIMAGVSN